MVDNPYIDEIKSENKKIRTFSKDVNEDDLVWHRDRKDRKIKVIYGKGWKIQFDNELPKPLAKNIHIFIKAGKYHRLHKGFTDLILEIEEI